MKIRDSVGLALEALQALLAALDFFDVGPPGMGAEALWRFLYITVTLFTWGFTYWSYRFHPAGVEESSRKKRAGFRLLLSILLLVVVVGGVGYSSSKLGRHLTAEQKAAFIDDLRGMEPRSVDVWTSDNPATEAGRYAADFIEVFVEAGWIVQKKEPAGLAPGRLEFYFQGGDPVATVVVKRLKEVNKEAIISGGVVGDPIKFIVRPLVKD